MKRYLLLALALPLVLPFTASASPYTDLTKVAKALGSVKSFQAVEDHGNGMKSVVTFVAPDRWRVDRGNVHELMIGNDMYMEMLGHWHKMPGAINAASMTAMIKNPFGAGAVSAIHVESETNGMTDGVPVRIFRYTRHDAPNVTATLSVNRRTWLPVQDVVVAPSSKTTVTYSKYNAPLSIVAPSM